jgi:hypothetical protein
MVSNDLMGEKVDALSSRIGTIEQDLAGIRTTLQGTVQQLQNAAASIDGLAMQFNEGRRPNWMVLLGVAGIVLSFGAAVLTPISLRIGKLEEVTVSRVELDFRAAERQRELGQIADRSRERHEDQQRYIELQGELLKEYARRVAAERAAGADEPVR